MLKAVLQADCKEDTKALFESLNVECKGCLESIVLDFVKYVAITRRLKWLAENRRQRLGGSESEVKDDILGGSESEVKEEILARKRAVADARESFIENFY